MIEKVKTSIRDISIKVSIAMGTLMSFAVPAGAQQDLSLEGGVQASKPEGAAENLFGQNSIFSTVSNILLFIVGAVSVIMLIIGGIRYVVSAGDQNAVQGAKNTILYAIVGIVVAFLAFAAVNFVTSELATNVS